MDEVSLDLLIENELYTYILAISNDQLDKVTKKTFREGINWFLKKYENIISENQINYVIDKTLQVFKNKKVKHINTIEKSINNKDER